MISVISSLFYLIKSLIWISQAFFIYVCVLMIKPQPGAQEQFLSTSADIAIYGGAAGGGKSFMLLLEATRHLRNKKFQGVGFRRETPQITNPGGLWDTSQEIYSVCNGKPVQHRHRWSFPSGATMQFSHLQYEKDKETWQGSQIPYIFFDELTHFSKSQFFYFFSRNRSTSGVKGYIRASCNPDPDSWVAKLIDWWIDPITGFPIPERSGVLRYLVVTGGNEFWFDTQQQAYDFAIKSGLLADAGFDEKDVRPEDIIKSFTFINSTIKDNQILLKKDPGYLGALLALPEEDRDRLLNGNWKFRSNGLGLCDYLAVRNIFTNHLRPDGTIPVNCITCDAARFGKDFCVIMVWRGWEMIHMSVYKKSDVNDIVDHIEILRKRFGIMKSNVLVDQDGVGGDSVKIGDYRGFRARDKAKKDPETRLIEDYENLKTQCAYRLCQLHVNTGNIVFRITPSNCLIYDSSNLKPKYSTKIMFGGKVCDVRDLLQEDLNSMKRVVKSDVKEPTKMEKKELQKEILGRSPDFGDTAMMRVVFDLIAPEKTFSQTN